MKNIKWSNIIISICYIASGIMFFSDTDITSEIICNWIGYGLLIAGALFIVSYFVHSREESFLKNEFCIGLIIITIGLLPLIRNDLFIELVYFVLAIVIMVSGYKKLQDCVDAWRLGLKYGLLYLVLSAISIVIGLVIMLDTTIDIKPLHILIGCGLVYSGISDLISTIFLSSKMYKFINEQNKNEENVEEEVANNETPEN